ncbi:MAG: CSLREA domain-containing protein [Xanthomonadales bacterium]|jgi:CSLREA domain-containing protein|nr:CSLREA domain-containing protein [Xanthomonadales bacterium]
MKPLGPEDPESIRTKLPDQPASPAFTPETKPMRKLKRLMGICTPGLALSTGLLLGLSAPVAAATLQTFNNAAAITIPGSGNASPYPSAITVSGVPTTFTRLEVQLNGFTHSFPDDVDVLLVGPQGQRASLMSDAGGGNPGVANLTLTFAQTASAAIPDASAPSSGLFRPANYANSAGDLIDTFPTPGPGALTDAPADLFAFNGVNPNGTWNLFVVDDASGDQGSISGGWTLRFTAPTVFTVNSVADTTDGTCNAAHCTLREAITAAQDGDLINFSLLFNTPQTINLLTALPDINRSITIQGAGAHLLTVRRAFNAATEFRIFSIAVGITNGVAISGMTITGGNAGSAGGGGIRSFSNLLLTNVHLSGNQAPSGGGVLLSGSDGIFTNCTFSGNTVTGQGGGIDFQGNNGRLLRAVNSTVSGNRASVFSGGINHVNFSGISSLEIINSTIVDNTGASGIITEAAGAGSIATTTLRNTIVAGNSPTNLVARNTVGTATFVTNGFNLSDNYNGVLTPLASDVTNANPRLAPLALYGGQTPTHALLHGSPALNAGDASGQATDQRGQNRPFIGSGASPISDIGAFEAQTFPAIVVSNTNNSGAGSLRNAIQTLDSVTDRFFDIQFDSATFGAPSTITLAGTELAIRGNMNILGPAANLLTISGNNQSRVFQVFPGITATLSGLSITGGNAGGGDGGGIFNDGTLNVTHSAIANNTSTANGGGIGSGIGDRTTLTHSTVLGNAANVAGGLMNNGVLEVSSSTISGNAAQLAAAGIQNQNGGGLTMTHSTLTANSSNAANGVGGIVNINSATTVIRNSIVAGNIDNTIKPDVSGSGFTSQGFNLIGNRGTVDFGATGDQSGIAAAPLNPRLGPLQNNGGTTATHALLFGSPALDRGNRSGATSDQRGLARPVDLADITNTSDASDIGAFEAQNAGAPPTVSYSPSPGTLIVFPGGGPGVATRNISVSSSGGVSPGAVSVANCTASSGFFITNLPINLTGTAGGAPISGSIDLSCTRGSFSQTGTLSCSETPTPGTTVTRSWNLSCPAVPAVPPNLAYNPTAGSTINYNAAGSASPIVVTPSGGSGFGLSATTTLGACTITGGGAAFPTTTIAQLSFVGATTAAQNLALPNCVPQAGQAVNATLSCPESRGGTPPSNRSWTLACPAGTANTPPTVSYTPAAGSTVSFPAGAAGTATSSIAIASTGGSGSGAVSVANCTASAGFTITNAPINFSAIAGTFFSSINLSCTRGASAQSGSLSCTETPSPGSAVTRSWPLNCPAAAADLIFRSGFESAN